MGQKKGICSMKKKVPKEQTQIEVPFDLALYLTRPDELEKLKRYVAYYLSKYGKSEEQSIHTHLTE